jgi:hypothetical protein
MKYKQITPLFVIGYLKDAHKYYKEECVVHEDWPNAEAMYGELLHAYHIYTGIKKEGTRKIRVPKKDTTL